MNGVISRMSVTDVILIITTTVTGIVTIINAIGNIINRQQVTDKLDTIHQSTNGNLNNISSKLESSLSEISNLRRIIRSMQEPPKTQESDRKGQMTRAGDIKQGDKP